MSHNIVAHRRRHRLHFPYMKLIIVTLCLCHLTFLSRKPLFVFGQTLSEECPHSAETLYEWESMDYYQLLGLKPPPDVKSKNKRKRKVKSGGTSTIDSKDIRKAYRQQAQLWHPDKISKSQSNSETSRRISTEESNARFARIAHAYEILTDPQKRQEYDSFLEYCERARIDGDNADQSSQLKKNFAKVWDNFKDPFRVFEDFFFGAEDENDNFYREEAFDPNDPFSFVHYHQRQQQQQQQQRQRYQSNGRKYESPPQDRPAHISQGKENLYDPMTGEAVVRVTQTEEYPPQDSHSGRFFYRIIAQEFKQRYDPYTTGLTYIPITDPYLQEEGYRYQSSSSSASTTSSASPVIESLLHSWEVMTPESKLLVSPNRRFVAGLSPDDCELLIMVDDPFDDSNHHRGLMFGEDDVYWSSSRDQSPNPFGKNYNSDGGTNNCFAVLKGPHLIVARGHPQGFGNQIIWYSKSGSEEDEADGSKPSRNRSYYEYEDEWGFWHRTPRSYLAQLDDDGSLAVYSVWSVPVDLDQGILSKILMTAKDLYYGRVPAQTQYGHLYYHASSTSASSSASSHIIYKRCIYSTSPVGCFRLGRRLTQLSLEFFFCVKRVISKMNHVADTWLDLIYEEDDIFYSIKESIWKNSHAFGSKMASSSARFVRKVMENFIQEDSRSGR
ncbi:DnaJ domain containing protein [Nitzschia inconspicua]|uniref:DnaJ domain containing protein n=1 Tax=Nitzschia inconspicua TaxID=303405 RepID=A0A9K3LBW9_9STRA|nr:DnaJ domain containing protein [Nitzschia inconspicua]